MSIFKRESLFALLAASVFIGGCGGGGGNASSTSSPIAPVTPTPVVPEPIPPVVDGSTVVSPGSPGDSASGFQVSISDRNLEPENQVTNTLVNFDGITTGGKLPLSYRWDFGDGTFAQTKAAPHRFSAGGTYQVTFTVVDANGLSASKMMQWKVSSTSVSFVSGNLDGSHHVNGNASQARFDAPSALAVAPDGAMYVAEANSKVIRKVLPDGTTTDFAGAPYATGSYDGVGSDARFEHLDAITVDGSGNVYVVDSDKKIRKVTPARAVTTLADVSTNSYNFFRIAANTQGTVFSLQGNSILKIVDGSVSEFVGVRDTPGQADGVASMATLSYPYLLTIDASNNLYVAELCSGIRKIAPDGTVSTLRRSTSNDPQTCSVEYATAIAVTPSGQVFRTRTIPNLQTEISQVDTLDNLGNWVLYAGANATVPDESDAGRSTARFSRLKAIAITPTGDLVVTGGSHTIRKIPGTGNVTRIAGAPDAVPHLGIGGVLIEPKRPQLAKYTGGLMVTTDRDCIKTLRFGYADGVLAGQCGTPGYVDSSNPLNARFSNITGVAVDSSNNIFVAETDTNVIRKITPSGVVSTYTAAAFINPTLLAMDSLDNLWVVDLINQRLRMVKPDGTISTIVIPQQCRVVTPAEICWIADIASDQTGSVYVSATAETRKAIFKLNAAGQINKIFPVNDYEFGSLGNSRIAVGPLNDVWEISWAGDVFKPSKNIRRIDPTGQATAVTTLKNFLAPANANGPEIEFTRPIDAAMFNTDGSLMMIGNRTAFQATGLQ